MFQWWVKLVANDKTEHWKEKTCHLNEYLFSWNRKYVAATGWRVGKLRVQKKDLGVYCKSFKHHSLNIGIGSQTHLSYIRDVQQTRPDLCRNLQLFQKASTVNDPFVFLSSQAFSNHWHSLSLCPLSFLLVPCQSPVTVLSSSGFPGGRKVMRG